MRFEPVSLGQKSNILTSGTRTYIYIGFFLCRNISFLNCPMYYEKQFYTLSNLMATIVHFNPGLSNANKSANAKCWRIQFTSFAIICPLHHLTVTGSLFINRLLVKLIDEKVGSVMYELALLSRIGVHYCLTFERFSVFLSSIVTISSGEAYCWISVSYGY